MPKEVETLAFNLCPFGLSKQASPCEGVGCNYQQLIKGSMSSVRVSVCFACKS